MPAYLYLRRYLGLSLAGLAVTNQEPSVVSVWPNGARPTTRVGGARQRSSGRNIILVLYQLAAAWRSNLL